MNTCQICNSELTNIKQTFRVRMKDNNNNSLGNCYRYQAWCSKCSISLSKTVSKQQESKWLTSNVKLHELDKEVSNEKLILLSQKIQEKEDESTLPRSKGKWKAFISMKKTTDKLFQYIQNNDTFTSYGLVIKRSNFLIGFYIYDSKNNQ